MPERRKSDRRTNPAVPEPIERKRERRQGDRRESLRKKATVVVKDAANSWEVAGEVGLGGASFALSPPPAASTLVVELRLSRTTTLRLPGKVTGTRGAVHLQFSELDARTELALAKWLDLDEA
jgi:hypothetical protein